MTLSRPTFTTLLVGTSTRAQYNTDATCRCSLPCHHTADSDTSTLDPSPRSPATMVRKQPCDQSPLQQPMHEGPRKRLQRTPSPTGAGRSNAPQDRTNGRRRAPRPRLTNRPRPVLLVLVRGAFWSAPLRQHCADPFHAAWFTASSIRSHPHLPSDSSNGCSVILER